MMEKSSVAAAQEVFGFFGRMGVATSESDNVVVYMFDLFCLSASALIPP